MAGKNPMGGVIGDFFDAIREDLLKDPRITDALRSIRGGSESQYVRLLREWLRADHEPEDYRSPLHVRLAQIDMGTPLSVRWQNSGIGATTEGRYCGHHSEADRNYLWISVDDLNPLQGIPFDWIRGMTVHEEVNVDGG